MATEQDADNLVETFKERINSKADSYKGLNKNLQFCLEDMGLTYLIHIGEEGKVTQVDKKPLKEGKFPSAHVTVITSMEVIDRLVKKELNPVMAMMQGKVRVEGDMGLLTKLASLFT